MSSGIKVLTFFSKKLGKPNIDKATTIQTITSQTHKLRSKKLGPAESMLGAVAGTRLCRAKDNGFSCFECLLYGRGGARRGGGEAEAEAEARRGDGGGAAAAPARGGDK